jgi:phosphoesterase RecJ-like protein
MKNFINKTEVEKLQKFLATKPKILILAHANPDGDTVGSSLALFLALRNLNFDVKVACFDPIGKLDFLPNVENFITDFDEKDFDAFFFMDCGDKKMTRFHDSKPRIFSKNVVKVNIDHHPTNDNFGEINFVKTKASSTAEIVFHLLKNLDFQITPAMATSLLTGLYTDTGGLQHQNTTPNTYFTASELIRLGGNLAKISKNIFRKYEFRTLKLWAKVLKNLHVTADGAAIVGVEKSDYEDLGATREDLVGIIDFINSMPEAQYSVLLSETADGAVKASLRTRKPNVNMRALAEKFGGGGHIKASGFTIKNSRLQKEIKWKIIKD